MIVLNRFSRHFIIIKSVKSNFNQQCCKNIRCISTVRGSPSNDFRKKTEKYSFNTLNNSDADSDIFGKLTDNIEINQKLDNLPPEPDDIIQYDKDEQFKRLHVTEYHKIIQELIKQHKVYTY